MVEGKDQNYPMRNMEKGGLEVLAINKRAKV